jgi:uncharacterized membrane protein YeaQ/YmgE (transglycosylase-associated protein family)
MHFSSENIFIILAIGIIVGLLPSTVLQRKGMRFVGDLAIGIIGVFIGGWLILAWHDVLPAAVHWLSSKPAEHVIVEIPREPVQLPLTARLPPVLKPIVSRSREEICDALADATRNNDLPAPFLIRLLYQESNFRPGVISSAGALGIAQFMPETATDRGIDNPFDPLQAIPASARLLRDLYRKFGNLGLAAAAYNAGPRRIADWLARKGQLPLETQNYVKTITGRPAETWTVAEAGSPALKLPQDAPCQELAGLLAWNGPEQIPLPQRNPRATNFSEGATVKQLPQQPRTQSASKKTDMAKREKGAAKNDPSDKQNSEKLVQQQPPLR